METEIITVQPTEADLKILQNVATKAFTATFGPYHDLAEVKKYTDEAYALAKLRQELLDPDSRTYFLKTTGQVIGYLKLNWDAAQTDQIFEDAMQLQRIYLLPEYWNQHLGNLLMEKALSMAKQTGVKIIWLGVWEHNKRARHFYERYGFKKAGSHTFVIGNDHQTDYWYARCL